MKEERDINNEKFNFFVLKYENIVKEHKEKNFNMKTNTLEEELELLKHQSKVIEKMLINEVAKWRVSYLIK